MDYGDDIFDFIDFSSDPEAPGVVFAPDPARPRRDVVDAPVQASRRERLPNPLKFMGKKPTLVDRRLHAWVKENFDVHDVARNSPLNQASNEAFERAMNAPPADWRSRLKMLALWEVAYSRHAGFKLYLKPKRPARSAGKPATVAARIDIDAHKGEPDAKALFDFVNSLFDGKVYDEPSANGWSGWFVLELAAMKFDGKVEFEKRQRTNAKMKLLQDALALHAAAGRFKSQVEIKGGYSLRYKDEEAGAWRIEAGGRGSMVKLPQRVATDAEMDRLAASRFPISVVNRIIVSAYDLVTGDGIELIRPELRAAADRLLDRRNWWAANVPTPFGGAIVARPAKKKRNRGRRAAGLVSDTGEKHKNRATCLSRVIYARLGKNLDREAVTDDLIDEIVDDGIELYERSGLTSGPDDAPRRAAMRDTAKAMLRKFDPAAGRPGENGIWFDLEEDVIGFYETRIRSMISGKSLWDYNSAAKDKLDGCRVTCFQLALAAATLAKNVAMSEGASPAKALIAMFKHFGIRSNGAHVAAITNILIARFGWFWTDRRCTTNRCRRYTIEGKALFAPFLMRVQEADQAREAVVEEKARRAAAGAGRGQRSAEIMIKLSRDNSLPEGTRYTCHEKNLITRSFNGRESVSEGHLAGQTTESWRVAV